MRLHLKFDQAGQQGFTIIEALISVAVLSFGLLAIGSFQAKLVSESEKRERLEAALASASEVRDSLRGITSALSKVLRTK